MNTLPNFSYPVNTNNNAIVPELPVQKSNSKIKQQNEKLVKENSSGYDENFDAMSSGEEIEPIDQSQTLQISREMLEVDHFVLYFNSLIYFCIKELTFCTF